MEKLMRKIITLMLVLALVITSIAFMPNRVEAKKFDHYTRSNLNSIKVYWYKVKKAKKYIVYRAQVKQFIEKAPKRKKYKIVKRTKKRYYNDKKVKKNKYYTYYVEAIGKKGNVIATSFYSGYPGVNCKGFDRPEIENRGIGEDGYSNSTSKIYVRCNIGLEGYTPKKYGYIIYRKNKNLNESFKKIKAKIVDKDDNIYLDTTVKAGETYQYKCKTYLKKKKKKYYSRFSNTVEVPAINLKAALALNVLTPSGEYEGRSLYVDFKVTDVDKYNGKVIFKNAKNNEFDRTYTCFRYKGDDEKMLDHRFEFNLVQYSKGGNTWVDIPRDGVELPKNGSIYLRAEIQAFESSTDTSIIFAGPDSDFYYSKVSSYDELARYFGSGYDHTVIKINFVKETIQVYNDWS